MSVREQVLALNRELTEQQKVRGGAVLILTGVALVGLLIWVDTAVPIQVLIGVMAVLLMVVGTLSVGTSGAVDRPV